MHYFPVGVGVATLFFAILLGLLVLIQIGLLGRVYAALGLDPRVATLVLFGSLIGSYINLPLVRLPEQRVVSREVVEMFGVPFLAPVTVDWPGTILAINVGGAVIPIMLSFYLLVRYNLWWLGAAATAIVAFVVHRMATAIPGVGISVPTFAPPLLAAVVALVLSRRLAAPIAYIGGSLGVLIGADLLNLGRLRSLGAPVASIGGAGTFDGIFLTGVIAVLLASSGRRSKLNRPAVPNLWRFCHIGPQMPGDGECRVDSRGTQPYSPAIVIGGEADACSV